VKKMKIEAAMGRYQQEVVRWNRQINLVSRKGTLGLVATLIRQCRDSFSVLLDAELQQASPELPVWYFDLGSGGGLPGYVWHHELLLRFSSLESWLVEPREKRAWFLQRLNQIAPERPFSVLEGLWGGQIADVSGLVAPGVVLVSLKALRLSDSVVLNGLVETLVGHSDLAGCRVVVARFYPPEQSWCKDLEGELGPLVESTTFGSLTFAPAGQAVLRPLGKSVRPASLIISRYDIL
jgi:hypothetical protein